MPDLSVIICAHNPRADYLRRVLEALKTQTLPREQWEFLLIDNASAERLADHWNLSWHQHARHVRENELGLTAARQRAIKESAGELLVFVDDDNVLDADYLEQAGRIASEWPMLGAWGGQVEPEFETAPEVWTKSYWHLLALKTVSQDRWANFPSIESFPVGAGMCLRKPIATEYAAQLSKNKRRALLGRRGQTLTSGEDMDIFLTTCQAGLGTGVFARLKLTHLISASRLEENYLVRLVEGVAYSTRAMDYMYSAPATADAGPRWMRWLKKLKSKVHELSLNARERRFHRAALRGRAMAELDFANPSRTSSPDGDIGSTNEYKPC